MKRLTAAAAATAHVDELEVWPWYDSATRAGGVVTLEPGSYGPDFGAWIEHNYLILAMVLNG